MLEEKKRVSSEMISESDYFLSETGANVRVIRIYTHNARIAISKYYKTRNI